MKYQALLFLFFLHLLSFAQEKTKMEHINHSPYVIVASNFSPEDVVVKLKAGIDNRKLTLFNEVPHHEGAEKIGQELPFTHLLIFGKPEMGTKLMNCDQSVGLELPLKMLVYSDGDSTYLKYQKPLHLIEHHNLDECKAILTKMTGMLDGLVNEVTKALKEE